MAAGQSLSNRRAVRSSYAESRARRHRSAYAPSAHGGGHQWILDSRGTHSQISLCLRDLSGYLAGRARHDVRRILTDGSSGVPTLPSPHRLRRCQFRLSRFARSSGDPRGGPPVIPEPRLAKRLVGRINS